MEDCWLCVGVAARILSADAMPSTSDGASGPRPRNQTKVQADQAGNLAGFSRDGLLVNNCIQLEPVGFSGDVCE